MFWATSKYGVKLGEEINAEVYFTQIRIRQNPSRLLYQSNDEPLTNRKQDLKVSFYLLITDNSRASVEERLPSLELCTDTFSFVSKYDGMSPVTKKRLSFFQIIENNYIQKRIHWLVLLSIWKVFLIIQGS